MSDFSRFKHLTFDDFRRMAAEPGLSRHEKVGFPDEYRDGREEEIFADIVRKLPVLEQRGRTVLEIGPGCSRLPVMLMELCARQNHRLLLVDSAEMLAQLPDAPHVDKIPGRYPEVAAELNGRAGALDAILAYSVVQYAFAEDNLWSFLDRSLSLLAAGGALLLGDIPNSSMRKRFFASDAGVRCHQAFTGTDEIPQVEFNQIEPGQMDDSVVMAVLMRARAQGFHGFVLPQGAQLPMANRREDILIQRP